MRDDNRNGLLLSVSMASTLLLPAYTTQPRFWVGWPRNSSSVQPAKQWTWETETNREKLSSESMSVMIEETELSMSTVQQDRQPDDRSSVTVWTGARGNIPDTA